VSLLSYQILGARCDDLHRAENDRANAYANESEDEYDFWLLVA
jgi:hypothetical protein